MENKKSLKFEVTDVDGVCIKIDTMTQGVSIDQFVASCLILGYSVKFYLEDEN